MIDLMTIRQRKGRLDHLTIGFCGDLKFGRTVHSLTAALSQFEGNRFVFISPEDLRPARYVKTESLEPTHRSTPRPMIWKRNCPIWMCCT